MILLTYTPQQPLAAFVEQFWYCTECMLPHARERVLPTGTAQLIVHLPDSARRTNCGSRGDLGPLVCGPRSQYAVIETASQASTLGVHFKPGGALPFLGVPVGELHNLHVPLEAVWGRTANALRDRLLGATRPIDRFRILEQFLLEHAFRAQCARHPAVEMALRAFHCVPHEETVAQVVDRAGLSARRFIQRFRDEVGLAPKLYCRIRRFQAALSVIARQQQPNWAQLAVDCGYYDQAHLIHDFQRLSGLSPTAYVRQKSEHLNHVALAD